MTSGPQPAKRYLTFWSMEPPYKDGRLRYHLGQVFMLAEMQRLLAQGNEVSAVVCDPPVILNARSRPESDSQRVTIERFLQAVQTDGIGLLRLSDLCRDARMSNPSGFAATEQALVGAFQRVNEAISDYDMSSQARRDLEAYRGVPQDGPLPLSLRGLVTQLCAAVPLHENELLPLLYAFSSRPSWFESQNLAATGAMLCQLNVLSSAATHVVEANRNAYPWLGLRALCRLAQVTGSLAALEFPVIVLTENVPSLTGGPYMRLAEPAGCLFVDASDRELNERINTAPAEVLAAVETIIDSTTVADQGQPDIASIVHEYRKRARAAGLLARVAPEDTDGADAVHLILRGGGAKGVALVGAADALWLHYPFRAFWGTSAGAIVAVLFGAGYQPDEVLAALTSTPVSSLIRTNRAIKWWNLLRHGAFYARDGIREWLDSLLSAKIAAPEPIRMSDLPFHTTIFAAQAGHGTRIFDSQGTGSDVAASFAVRSSMAVPFVFRPTSIEGANVYDGGLTNNFPLRQFRLSPSRDEPYIGILLRPDHGERPRWWWRLLPTAQEVFGIWMDQDEGALLREHHDRLVVIDTSPIRTLQLDLSAKEVEFLISVGREQGVNYLRRHGLATSDEATAAAEAVHRLRPNVRGG